MKKLSKKEWVAIAAALVFVIYTLFGGDITALFQKAAQGDSLAAVSDSLPGSNGGVIVNDVIIGEGDTIKQGQLVSVHYVLSLADGTVVQSSKDFGVPFQFVMGAGQVIPGWEQGLESARVGGIRTMVIPPELAYGSSQAGPIPPNSTLVFTVEILDATSSTSVAPDLVQ